MRARHTNTVSKGKHTTDLAYHMLLKAYCTSVKHTSCQSTENEKHHTCCARFCFLTTSEWFKVRDKERDVAPSSTHLCLSSWVWLFPAVTITKCIGYFLFCLFSQWLFRPVSKGRDTPHDYSYVIGIHLTESDGFENHTACCIKWL